jgi:hypothetical protein
MSTNAGDSDLGYVERQELNKGSTVRDKDSN